MNIVYFRGRTFWSYYQSMGLEFSHALGKVLGTQDRPTLKLVSHRCVLCFNLIKSMFNTCIYTYTHTSIQHDIFHPKHDILIYLPKQKRTKRIKKTLTFIYHVKTYHTYKTK